MNSPDLSTVKVSNPIRVAIVHYRDDATVGGSLRVGETIANNLDPARIEASLVFAYGEPGPVSEKAKGPVHHLRARSSRDLRSWFAARDLFKEFKPDIIHFVDPVNWIALVTLGLGPKHLFHFHGRPIVSRMSLFDKLLMRARRHVTDGFVGITQGATNAAVEARFAKPGCSWTVYNGVDIKAFENLPSREEARDGLKLPRSAKLIGQVARVTRYNGGAELLDVLLLLPEQWQAVFVGDGPFRHELEQIAIKRGLNTRVHFTGVLQDVRPAYAALDAIALTARYQPFCLMLAEAMVTGVPVFGLLGDGEYTELENPLITPNNSVFVNRPHPEDYESVESPEVIGKLAEKITQYGQHPERFSVLIENGRRHVRERFGAVIQAESITKIYLDMLGIGEFESNEHKINELNNTPAKRFTLGIR